MLHHNDERLLLSEVRNHSEFKEKLSRLGLTTDFGLLDKAVRSVAAGWLRLGLEHFQEMKNVDLDMCPRIGLSRSYYAVYNASKAVRYLSKGWVSLKGDDHHKVSDLPDAFPNVDEWTRKLQTMYEHRLRADYDNWSGTSGENTMKPADALQIAEEFLRECMKYLEGKYGLNI